MHKYSKLIFGITAAFLCTAQAEETTPSQATDRLPVFSWDRVPQYMHIRKAAKFTDAEIKYLASFPLVA